MSANENYTLSVPVVRNKDGVDVDATLEEARKLVQEYADEDSEATQAVIKVTNDILDNNKWKDVTNITSSTLAKMALGAMDQLPTDKLCSETEARVKAYLQGQPEKFLYVHRGRNAGFHFKDRLSDEALKKLVKD